MRLKSYFPTTIDIDGESIAIRIKRQGPDEARTFRERFSVLGTDAGKDIPETDHVAFVVEAFKAYVTVEPEQLYLDDGATSITEGDAFARAFGARMDVLTRVLTLIHVENCLSAADKERFYNPRPPQAETSTAEADATTTQSAVTH